MPNNGMHPTRDTLLVKFNQRQQRAGDAGRYAAKCSIVCNDATIGGLINPFRKEGNV